ncbi:MAG: ABC transporter permease [Nitrososphaerales archaeon]
MGILSEVVNHGRVIYARAYVRLRGLQREPQWSIAEVIIPMLSISAYIYMYQVLSAPNEFLGFVIVGGAMLAFWSNVLWGMSSQFYWEKETGTLELYMIAPISRMAVLLGMALGGILNTTIRALSILIIGITLFPIQFAVGDLSALIIIFVLAVVSLYGMGILFASLFLLYGREATHMADLLQEPIYVLSGMYYPVLSSRFFPFAVKFLASAIPLTLGIDGIRQIVILGGDFNSVILHIVGLVVLASVLLPLSYLALRKMEQISKREGRLTLRWQ